MSPAYCTATYIGTDYVPKPLLGLLSPPRTQLLQFKGLGNLEDDVRLLLSQLQRMQVDHAASDRRASALSELRGLVRAGGEMKGKERAEYHLFHWEEAHGRPYKRPYFPIPPLPPPSRCPACL